MGKVSDRVGQDSCPSVFTNVSWSYDPVPDSLPTAPKHQKAFQSYIIPSFYAKPPHYHASLYTHPHLSLFSQYGNNTSLSDSPEEVRLNPDLIGMRLSTDALTAYEMDVGFYCSSSIFFDSGPFSRTRPLSQDVHPDVVAMNIQRLQEIFRELTGGLLRRGSPHETQVSSSRSISAEVTNSPSPSNTHATQSRNATETSMSHSDDRLSAAGPSDIMDNDSVISLIPESTPVNRVATPSRTTSSRQSTPSLAFTNFTFPSLNETRHDSSPPPVKEVICDSYHKLPITYAGKTSSTSLKSNTRALVTILRAAGNQSDTCKTPLSSPRSSPKPAQSPSISSNTSNSADLDFFARAVPATSEDGVGSLSSRSSPSPFVEGCEGEGDEWVQMPSGETYTTQDKAQSGSSSSASPIAVPEIPLANDEGWIEGPSQLLAHPIPKPIVRKHINHLAAPLHDMPPPHAMPLPHTTIYPIAPYNSAAAIGPALPHMPLFYPANAYFHMQMHLHAQMQLQMQMQACGGGADWYHPLQQMVYVPAAPQFGPPAGTPGMLRTRYHNLPPVINNSWYGHQH